MDHSEFSELIENEYDYERPKRGEVKEATIIEVTESDIMVDLGGKRDGRIPAWDLDQVEEEIRAGLNVGDQIPVVISKPFTDLGTVQVSLSRGLQQADWLRAQELMEQEEAAEVEVAELNRGGAVVGFGRLRGFIPNSQLDLRGLPRDPDQDDPREALIGTRLWAKIIEVTPRRRRLILSPRAARAERRRQLMQELSPGEVRTGTVRNLASFGAFVDLGGVDGLIHVSELDWRFVNHPSEVVSVGDEVEVEVLSVDRDRQRIGLSRKRRLAHPFERVADSLAEGDTVLGKIVRRAPFGLFVDLGEGVEGLVHNSEIPAYLTPMLEDLMDTDTEVRVLRIDRDRKRIGLSLFGIAAAEPEAPQEEPASEDETTDWTEHIREQLEELGL
ncbi:MAG: S1 RNA-binding domain-containing protein [Anaerolineae bacterium]|nr:S1 RNA-binding domain-containing protein [Anaerolineae bacterium]